MAVIVSPEHCHLVSEGAMLRRRVRNLKRRQRNSIIFWLMVRGLIGCSVRSASGGYDLFLGGTLKHYPAWGDRC